MVAKIVTTVFIFTKIFAKMLAKVVITVFIFSKFLVQKHGIFLQKSSWSYNHDKIIQTGFSLLFLNPFKNHKKGKSSESSQP